MMTTQRAVLRRVRLSNCLVVAIAGYIGLIAAVCWSLATARQWALAQLATPESIRQWEAWRDDVRRQESEPGPVRHRVPKSAEPPALVLMRDYFFVSLVGAVLFTTLLYWLIAWLVRGILSAPTGDTSLRTAPPRPVNHS
jgi:hypothetical protein